MVGDAVPRVGESDGDPADTIIPEANIVAVSAVVGAIESALGPSSRDKLGVPLAENGDGTPAARRSTK